MPPQPSLRPPGPGPVLSSGLVLLLASCAFRPPAPADGARVEGEVLYSTRAPVAGALVLLEGGIRGTADGEGRFRFDGVPPGRRAILAVAPGCRVAGGEILVTEGQTRRVRLVVPLEGEESWPLGPRGEGVSLRVITAEDLRRMQPTSVVDAIRRAVPEMVLEASGYAGGRPGVTGRGRNTATGSMTPLVVVDGVLLLGRPFEALATLDPLDVLRIEIVRGASGGWSYGLAGVNGVVRIVTRSGAEREGPRTPPEECGFRAPSGGPDGPPGTSRGPGLSDPRGSGSR